MYQDKTLTCQDCGNTFVFSAAEQEFFAEKGFSNEPKRCPDCRSARKQRNGRTPSRQRSQGPREMFPAVCATCGKMTQVPFQPSGDKPVYCMDCYSKKRSRF